MKKCSICARPFAGVGHNPAPLIDDIEARCCDECNDRVVIPTRLLQMFNGGAPRA